jgi:hypothetical protein
MTFVAPKTLSVISVLLEIHFSTLELRRLFFADAKARSL